jgi:hypothetical protein
LEDQSFAEEGEGFVDHFIKDNLTLNKSLPRCIENKFITFSQIFGIIIEFKYEKQY